ncbi:MAG: DUF2085 domain-containing protein [Candidatus Hodarchaeota archaeon]
MVSNFSNAMPELNVKKNKKNVLRTIFMNILIVIFIVMCYFYLSEAIGSISYYYIIETEFSIIFGGTLFLFTFFSVLAGPIQSLISGFLAELFYQIIFYRFIYFEWCIIVGLYGLICGIYRYKPLKYHESMKIYYTFLILVIASFILTFLIIIIQATTMNFGLNFEEIFVNFGFKFIIQALISTTFLVPLCLVIYDRILSSKERYLYYLLLTHHPISASDHTFYFQFGRTKIFFCSRCSGVIIGGILAVFFTHLIELFYGTMINAEIALLVIIFFPIPGLIDWGTQRLLLRKSTTESRLLTGFIIGVALHFLTFTYNYYFITIFLITLYFGILFLLIYLGHKKEMKKLSQKMDQLSSEEINEI